MTGASDGLVDVLRGAGIVFLGTIVGRGLGLLGEIFIARILLPNQLGKVALSYTIVSTLAVIVTFGTSKGVPRLMSGDEPPDRQQRLLLSGLLLTLPIGFIGLCSIYLLSSSISQIFRATEIAQLLPLFGVYLITYPTAQVTVSGLRGLERAGMAVTARSGGRIFALCCFALLVWSGSKLTGAILYYIITHFVISIFAGYFLYTQLSSSSKDTWIPRKIELQETFSFSWPLAISSGFLVLMGNLDVLMVGYFRGSTQVGYYRVIQPLALLLLVVLSSFVFLFMPVATKYYKRGNDTVVENLFRSTTKIVSIISYPVALVFILFSKDVIIAFYGGVYAPAAFAFTILVIGTYLRIFVGPNAAMIEAIGRTRVDMISAVAGIAINIILNLWLIPIYGISGAAVATSVGYLTYNFIELGVIYQSINTHPFSLNTLKPLVPTTVVAIAIAEISPSRSLELGMLIGIGIVIATVQLIAVFATDSLDSTDALIIARIERRLGVEIPFSNRTALEADNKKEEL